MNLFLRYSIALVLIACFSGCSSTDMGWERPRTQRSDMIQKRWDDSDSEKVQVRFHIDPYSEMDLENRDRSRAEAIANESTGASRAAWAAQHGDRPFPNDQGKRYQKYGPPRGNEDDTRFGGHGDGVVSGGIKF